jgi:hypothetical protein
LRRISPRPRPRRIPTFSTNRGKAFSRRDCQEKGGWGQTTQIEKEKSGVLRTVRDGKKVLVPAGSLFPHLIERVIASHPARGPKPRRKPTPQELEGLRKGNEQRRLEGDARRAEKVRRAQEAAAASA